jgi:hypothetical protein
MVPGFNHNVMYRGEVFHVQTEDSGVANPRLITLLYKGGAILCSIKTSYADILKVDGLEQVVAELMKEQHKEMMRRLKSGEFAGRAFTDAAESAEVPAVPSAPQVAETNNSLHSSHSEQQSPPAGTDDSSLPDLATPQAASTGHPSVNGDVAGNGLDNLDDAVNAFFGASES